MGVFLQERGQGSWEKGEGHDHNEQNGGAALALHELVYENCDQARQEVVADPEEENGDESDPEARRAQGVEAHREAQFESEKEEPERIEDTDEVTRNTAVG